MLTTPLARAASTMASAEAVFSANGFSQNTGLPSAKAASLIARWVSCWEAITIASTAGSATSSRQSPVLRLKPRRSAAARAPSAERVAIISQRGRNAVLNTAPTACNATAWALPM